VLADNEASGTLRLTLRHAQDFDLRLVNSILGRPGRTWPEDVSEFEMARGIDVLGAAIKNFERVRLPMLRFLRTPFPFIRSRMATLSFRLKPNDAWFDSLARDPDPRVRANLIEVIALEENLTPIRRALCLRASADPHHRVQTTALYVVATFGSLDARPKLQALRHVSNESFQRAGAWALRKLDADARQRPGET
jgi:hypothetical protein